MFRRQSGDRRLDDGGWRRSLRDWRWQKEFKRQSITRRCFGGSFLSHQRDEFGTVNFGVVMNEWMNHAKRSTMWFHADISFFICPNIFLRDWIRLSGECSIMIWICVRGFVAASSTLAHTWVRKIYCFIEWLYGRICHTLDGGWDGDVMLAVAMVFFYRESLFGDIARWMFMLCMLWAQKSQFWNKSIWMI